MTTTRKTGRNELCPCGSGLKYKYCCINKELRPRQIPINAKCDCCGNDLTIDFTKDILNIHSSAQLPLKNFCKDNDLYFFGLAVTVGQALELHEKLKLGQLTKKDILDTFKSNFKGEHILNLLNAIYDEMELFKKRKEILSDGFEAHFSSKYTLSIPTLFPQLEGLLRETGGLKNSESIRPTIPVDIWEERLLFSLKDDAQNYNGFIHKLFEGSKDADTFNRNPILHGFKLDYYSEEHSMLVMLSILEIRLFNWWLKRAPKFADRVTVTKTKK